MTTRTRVRKQVKARLESLEAREAPTVGLAGAWAAVSQSWAQGMRGEPAQRGIPVPGSGAPLQSMPSYGNVSNVGWSPAAPTPSPSAPVLPTPSQSRSPLFNVFGSRPVWAVHTSMRAPTVVPSPTTPTVPAPPTPTIVPVTTPPTTPTTPMTNANAGTPAQSLPPNVSGVLNALYQGSKGSTTVPVSDAPGSLITDGTNVGVSVHGNGQGSFSTFVSTLQNLGMQINASDDVTWTVSGMLPISQLPTAAQTPQTLSITPMYRPATRSFGGFLRR